MSNKIDVDINIYTRGDDIEVLNRIANMISSQDEVALSYISYIKLCIMEKLVENGEIIPKEDFPIGHPLGFTDEEFEEWFTKELRKGLV